MEGRSQGGHTMQSNVVADNYFLPSTTGPIEYLLSEYDLELERIERLSEILQAERNASTVQYFIDGIVRKEKIRMFGHTDLFNRDYAVGALNSKYWNKALDLTDVLDHMPSKRRSEWTNNIQEMNTPDFEPDTVMDTIKQLLDQRMDFLAEMVDGIFTGLSGEHVTNRPEAFGKRMIIDCVCDMYSSYGSRKVGLIHDMRCVVARFRGKDVPHYRTTNRAIDNFKENTGTWHMMDAGAFRIRVYKKGTAHLEINPDIAYRLNQILAYLHPMAIAAPHRRKPKTKSKLKEFQLLEKPIPYPVLNAIADAKYHGKNAVYNPHHLSFGLSWSKKDKHLRKAVSDVMEAIGATPCMSNTDFQFDYDAQPVIEELITSGVVPDSKSHQFYPTPESLAAKVVEEASISQSDEVLEPSAGQGAIACLLPADQTTCVEINPLNCKILEAKGLNVACADFLQWENDGKRFDKIVMNPPYSEGRFQAHLNHAVTLLKPGGKLVAILPSNYIDKIDLPTMSVTWSTAYKNKFAGTSISVAILTAGKV